VWHSDGSAAVLRRTVVWAESEIGFVVSVDVEECIHRAVLVATVLLIVLHFAVTGI
jgi:hypothetical protein